NPLPFGIGYFVRYSPVA
ncbi:hypothetical protein KPH14_012819, partial [Odynerus spinipes]